MLPWYYDMHAGACLPGIVWHSETISKFSNCMRTTKIIFAFYEGSNSSNRIRIIGRISKCKPERHSRVVWPSVAQSNNSKRTIFRFTAIGREWPSLQRVSMRTLRRFRHLIIWLWTDRTQAICWALLPTSNHWLANGPGSSTVEVLRSEFARSVFTGRMNVLVENFYCLRSLNEQFIFSKTDFVLPRIFFLPKLS